MRAFLFGYLGILVGLAAMVGFTLSLAGVLGVKMEDGVNPWTVVGALSAAVTLVAAVATLVER